MAIPTSNITMTGIATELGISTSNISLDSLGDKMIVIDPGSSRQTFTLTDTITLTTDDTSVAANMNTGSGSTQMSEFGGYTKANPIQFSTTSAAFGEHSETVNSEQTVQQNACFVPIRQSAGIYCQRSGNDLVWYVMRGNFSANSTHRKESSSFTSDTECARLAGIASNTSTTVSVTYSSAYLQTGFTTFSSSALSTGSTSSNLVSSNTKIGFEFRVLGQGESQNQQTLLVGFNVDFTVSHPNHVPRVFRFPVAMKGRYTAGAQEAC